MSYSKVIAIDGPSGSGKSSLAKLLSQRLNVLYVNTGSHVSGAGIAGRGVGSESGQGGRGREFFNQYPAVLCPFPHNSDVYRRQGLHSLIDSPKASMLACSIAQINPVRNFLVKYQRILAKDRVCVMEGRDIGTVVFPNAFIKFFLTASLETRVQRRWKQLKSKGKKYWPGAGFKGGRGEGSGRFGTHPFPPESVR